jgi:peroxiredoxin
MEKININKLKLNKRKTWIINPKTRVVPKKKKKSRKRIKQEIIKEINNDN